MEVCILYFPFLWVRFSYFHRYSHLLSPLKQRGIGTYLAVFQRQSKNFRMCSLSSLQITGGVLVQMRKWFIGKKNGNFFMDVIESWGWRVCPSSFVVWKRNEYWKTINSNRCCTYYRINGMALFLFLVVGKLLWSLLLWVYEWFKHQPGRGRSESCCDSFKN